MLTDKQLLDHYRPLAEENEGNYRRLFTFIWMYGEEGTEKLIELAEDELAHTNRLKGVAGSEERIQLLTDFIRLAKGEDN